MLVRFRQIQKSSHGGSEDKVFLLCTTAHLPKLVIMFHHWNHLVYIFSSLEPFSLHLLRPLKEINKLRRVISKWSHQSVPLLMVQMDTKYVNNYSLGSLNVQK